MPDPGYPLNCPRCGKPLTYIRTQDDAHFYRCPQHGLMVLPPEGRVREEDPQNPVTRH